MKKQIEESQKEMGNRRRIPIGGIKIPGFLRSSPKEKNKVMPRTSYQFSRESVAMFIIVIILVVVTFRAVPGCERDSGGGGRSARAPVRCRKRKERRWEGPPAAAAAAATEKRLPCHENKVAENEDKISVRRD